MSTKLTFTPRLETRLVCLFGRLQATPKTSIYTFSFRAKQKNEIFWDRIKIKINYLAFKTKFIC